MAVFICTVTASGGADPQHLFGDRVVLPERIGNRAVDIVRLEILPNRILYRALGNFDGYEIPFGIDDLLSHEVALKPLIFDLTPQSGGFRMLVYRKTGNRAAVRLEGQVSVDAPP
jgi:hypothetical protein